MPESLPNILTVVANFFESRSLVVAFILGGAVGFYGLPLCSDLMFLIEQPGIGNFIMDWILMGWGPVLCSLVAITIGTSMINRSLLVARFVQFVGVGLFVLWIYLRWILVNVEI
jgi:hypothetical protein